MLSREAYRPHDSKYNHRRDPHYCSHVRDYANHHIYQQYAMSHYHIFKSGLQ